jgi:outer membrane protein with beta-barrel domain
MNKISASFMAIVGLGACAASATALAADPLGIYVGAGVGESNLRSDGYGYNDYYGYDNHQTTWKAMVGVRPVLSPIGAEFEYIDFGSANVNSNYFFNGNYFNGDNSRARATALFGVGYLPLGLPFLDVFGKAGVARLQENEGTYYTPCPAPETCVVTNIGYSNWTTNFAYGLGVQTRFGNLGLRAEYERISATGGDPDALTVSATWTF